MFRLVLTLLCLGLLTNCGKSTAPKAPAQPPLAAVQAHIIIPWHQALLSASGQLKNRLERFCQNPGNPGEFQEARNAWRNSMLAWQQVNLIKFGPVSQDNQAWKIQFWPDSHNLVEKKVKALLAENDVINEQILAGASVVTQGLSALELFLFDAQFADSAALAGKPCDLMRIASGRVEKVAAALAANWQQGSQGAWQAAALTPGSEAEQAALADTAKALVSSLEIIKKDKLEGPIGNLASPEAKPFHSESWRSATGKAAMLAQLKGCASLFDKALVPFLTSPEQQALSRSVQSDLAQLIASLEANPAELVDLINTEQGRTLVVNSAQTLGKINGIMKRDIPTALNLQLGFNGNDGD